MRTKLLLIEGIPGSGKSTLSRKAAEYLSQFTKTTLYNEGGLHPADVCWCACVPLADLGGIIARYPTYEDKIRANMYIENGYAMIAYVQFHIEEKDSSLYTLMESYEVYDGRASFDVFSSMHFSKWEKFAKEAVTKDELTVFECSFLQNHINELLLFRNMCEEDILDHLQKLISIALPLEPVLIYLNPNDAYETIKRISKERRNDAGGMSWEERVIKLLEDCPYGKARNLKGFDGMVDYFAKRQKLELQFLNKLPIKSIIVSNDDFDWEKVWEKVEGVLKENVL